MDWARRFTVADVTPIATTPSSAALRPRRPPSAASAAAIPNHSRELLAALDNRRIGSSREGVGVSAMAAYVARSTEPSSRSAVVPCGAWWVWPWRLCAAASTVLGRGLRGCDDMRRLLGRPGGRLGSVRASRRLGAIVAFAAAGGAIAVAVAALIQRPLMLLATLACLGIG